MKKTLKFNDDSPIFNTRILKTFHLISTQETIFKMYFPEVVSDGIRLVLYFANILTISVEMFVSGKRIRSIEIDKKSSVTEKRISKNSYKLITDSRT